ncbi:MAG: amidophosphoribosyltransferase [Bacteroides sp. SM23_62_1]|nr:MAG: amidophosphoribosyltransferase [Bacteroides sp. SM23_62_1]
MEWLHDFINLIFPANCAACGNILMRNERIICSECIYHLPKTDFHLIHDNPVARIFWGRIMIEQATAYYFFNKGSRFRRLIHELKYQGRQDIGYELGRAFGHDLLNSGFRDIDMVIPIPLHRNKLRRRGYNQSESIAGGIAESMDKPVSTTSVIRVSQTGTQTRKSRYERWLNVKDVFRVTEPLLLAGKHILLVDDVLTTGATMEACAAVIQEVKGTKVSIAALAVA